MPSSKVESSRVFRSNRDVAIHVPDLEKAKEFYGKVLGFKLISGNESLAFETGTFRLWINEGKPQSFVPSFTVSDRAASRQYLIDHGCTPLGSQMPSYFKDP